MNGQYDSGVSDIYAEKILDADSHELLQVEGTYVC